MPPPQPGRDPATQLLLRNHGGWIAEANEAYWSWDELRRRPIPGGLGPEAAWDAVELVRGANRRPLPLLRGRGDRSCSVWVTDRAWFTLLTVQGAVADPLALAEAAFGPASRRRFLNDSLIEEAVESSILEGAVSTRREGRRLLREGRIPRGRSERMMVNYLGTMTMLREAAEEPLSGDLIRQIHRAVTRDTLDDARNEGRLQQPGEQRVRVEDFEGHILHVPPPADELPARIDALCRFANEDQELPDAVRAILLHYQLGFDHPFVDGNGRTARALFYWSMLRAGHSLMQYPSISAVLRKAPGKYSRAYQHCAQTGDLSYFVLHQLGVLGRALEGFAGYVKRKIGARRDADEALREWGDLNLRQRLAVRHLLEDRLPLRAPSFAATFSVTRATALSDLKGLAEAGLLEERRVGRKLEYAAPADLDERISAGPDPSGRPTLDFDDQN